MATYNKRGYKPKTKEEKVEEVEQQSTTAEVFNTLDETASKTEDFVAKNQKYIFIIRQVSSYLIFPGDFENPGLLDECLFYCPCVGSPYKEYRRNRFCTEIEQCTRRAPSLSVIGGRSKQETSKRFSHFSTTSTNNKQHTHTHTHTEQWLGKRKLTFIEER